MIGSYLANQQAFNIQSETEVAVILSNFSTDYIYGAINDMLKERTSTFTNMSRPNYVMGLEASFKEMLDAYPSDRDNILATRDKTYEEIMNIIAKSFNLELSYDETIDKFSMASYMYDFFVSNYDQYLCQFFSRFISREKEGLYAALCLDESKKSKDISTIYNRKTYVDQKMAIINANLDKVIGYISNLDFDMNTILNFIYPDKPETVSLFLNHVKPMVDFFQSAYVGLLQNPMVYPLARTSIMLELQRNNTINDLSSFQQSAE